MIKKIFLVFFTFSLLLANSQVLALSLEKNNINILAGEKQNIKLYANLPKDTVKVEFTLVFDSYDLPVYFSPTTGISDETPNGIKHTLILKTASSGKTFLGNIVAKVVDKPSVTGAGADIHTAAAYNSSGKKTTLNSRNLFIKVGKEASVNPTEPNDQEEPAEDKPKTYNLLKEIKNGDTIITMVDNIYEYDLSILNSVKELSLEVVPKDEKYHVDISTQIIKDLIDDKVTITVANGEEKQVYTLNIKTIKDTPDIEIDESVFEESNSYKGFWIVAIIFASVGLFFGITLNNIKK